MLNKYIPEFCMATLATSSVLQILLISILIAILSVDLLISLAVKEADKISYITDILLFEVKLVDSNFKKDELEFGTVYVLLDEMTNNKLLCYDFPLQNAESELFNTISLRTQSSSLKRSMHCILMNN